MSTNTDTDTTATTNFQKSTTIGLNHDPDTGVWKASQYGVAITGQGDSAARAVADFAASLADSRGEEGSDR